jgi:hypothetical protein
VNEVDERLPELLILVKVHELGRDAVLLLGRVVLLLLQKGGGEESLKG